MWRRLECNFESLKYLIPNKGELHIILFSLVTVNFVTLFSSLHLFTYIQPKKCHDPKKEKGKKKGLVTWWFMFKKKVCSNRKKKKKEIEWNDPPTTLYNVSNTCFAVTPNMRGQNYYYPALPASFLNKLLNEAYAPLYSICMHATSIYLWSWKTPWSKKYTYIGPSPIASQTFYIMRYFMFWQMMRYFSFFYSILPGPIYSWWSILDPTCDDN